MNIDEQQEKLKSVEGKIDLFFKDLKQYLLSITVKEGEGWKNKPFELFVSGVETDGIALRSLVDCLYKYPHLSEYKDRIQDIVIEMSSWLFMIFSNCDEIGKCRKCGGSFYPVQKDKTFLCLTCYQNELYGELKDINLDEAEEKENISEKEKLVN